MQQTAPPAYDRIEAMLAAVAVIVAALGVMFTVAAFILAVFAFYGKREFLQLAKNTARATATEWVELWAEKNLTPEGMYAEYIRRNKPPENAPPEPMSAVEASDQEGVQPITNPPVEAEPNLPVTQEYPREEEPNVVQAEREQPEHRGDELDPGEEPKQPE